MDDLMRYAGEMLQEPGLRALLVVLGSLLAAWVMNLVLYRLLARFASTTDTDLDDRLIRLSRRPVFYTILLAGLWIAVRILRPAPETTFVLVALIQTAGILLWLVSGMRIISTLLDGMSRLADRVTWLEARTLPLFDNLAKLLLFGGAAYGLLLAWRLDVAPWLASAGIAGIALGFAAKDTLANVFGGLFVIIDAPYSIGDYIDLDSGERGQVIKIGLRSTRLLTRDDIEITVPNAAIANAKVVNESGGRWIKSRLTVQVGVAYGSDVEAVRRALLDAARSVPEVLDEPEPRVRFAELGDSALIFRVLCWIAHPEERGRCIDGLNTAIYNGLNAAGISIPFPQRDVHLRTPPA